MIIMLILQNRDVDQKAIELGSKPMTEPGLRVKAGFPEPR